MAAIRASVAGLHVGTSGFSYPSWRPGFYPAGLDPREFLSFYAARFDTVELNTTGYRLPAEEQFHRWARSVPDGFRFAVKMPSRGFREVSTFEERVRSLGDRLGPVRVVVQQARDEGLLPFFLGSISLDLRYAFDFRHESWAGPKIDERLSEIGAVRVGALESAAPFRYLRFREPPYSDEQLTALAARIRPLLVAGLDVFCYFRHEDEPAAPAYAGRLGEALSSRA